MDLCRLWRLSAALAAAFLLLGQAAWAQAITQSGPVLNGGGHPLMYLGGATGSSLASAMDPGPASGGPIGTGISELLLQQRTTGTGPYGTNDCDWSTYATNPAGANYICRGFTASGVPLFATNNSALDFIIGGGTYSFPASLTGMAGPATSNINDFVLFNNATGNLTRDGGPAALTPLVNLGTTPITTSGQELWATVDRAITVNSLIGSNVNYDTIAGVSHNTLGSTLTNINSVAGYALNDNTPGGVSKNSVALYGWALDNTSGSWSWGINTLCNTKAGLASGANCFNEFDMNFNNAGDLGTGLLIQGGSTVQPSAATGLEIGPLSVPNPAIKWNIGFITLGGCCSVALQVGPMATSGSSIFGQPAYFQMRDSTGALQSFIWQATPTGMAFSGTQAIPLWQFNGNLNIGTNFGLLINGDAIATDVSHAVAFASDVHITGITLGNGIVNTHVGGSASALTILDGPVQASTLGTQAHASGNACLGYNSSTNAIYISSTVTTC